MDSDWRQEVEVEVLVVGSGPTGLVLATELARRGILCRIIDKSPAPAAHSQALGIQARTLEIFESMGIAGEFIAGGWPVRGGKVYSSGRPIIHIRFDSLDSPFPYILAFPQSRTEAVLQSKLNELGVMVERRTELLRFEQNADGVVSTIRDSDGKERECHSQWLIGCDGAHSRVRKVLNLEFEGAEYPELFILADARLEGFPSGDELHFELHEQGPLGIIPMGGGLFRVFAIIPPDTDEEKPEPSLDQVQSLLDARGPGGITARDPIWISYFRLHRRIVQHFRAGRVFLAGDAAHIHSPAGGQGMNTGIQDAFNLGWKLAAVASGDALASLLDTYEAERLPVAKSVLHGTDEVTRAIALQNPLAQYLRDHIAPLLMSFKAVRHHLGRQISELAVSYPHSPLSEDHGASNGPAPGERAPDAIIEPGDPQHRLFGLFAGMHWTLLLFDNGDSQTGAEAAEVFQDAVGPAGKVYRINVAPASLAQPDVVADPDRRLHDRYGIKDACAFLIRPDGYVGFRGPAGSPDVMRHYLSRHFLAHRNIVHAAG